MRFVMVSLVCLTVAAILVGCGGGGSGSGVSGLQIYITDAPIDAHGIIVTITSVEVHEATAGWVTLKTYDPPLEIDLMDYQARFEFDGDPATQPEYLLLDQPLAAGHYTMVRLHVSGVGVVLEEGAEPIAVDMNNLDQTGIKLNREFTVASGQSVALLLDFNGKSSIVEMGQGSYKLQPVIAMVPKDISATIKGTVAFMDASPAPVPVPEGAVLEVYEAGGTTLAGSGSISTEDGSFAIGCLLPGTYDLKVNATGYAADTVRLPGVVVGVAETKDVGTITVSPP